MQKTKKSKRYTKENLYDDLRFSNLSGKAKPILFALWINIDKNNQCFPGYETLLILSGTGDRRTLKRYLNELAEKNIILIKQRKKNGSKQNMSNLYTFITKENRNFIVAV